ncbi:MAG: EAL domain-containing protein [Hyphomicrobiaceae bacterium]|nr:EAL domain-containing protein [Hyphomicrobiaceae bacterium]
MTAQFAVPNRDQGVSGSLAEVFVLCAMAFATLAAGTALTLQAGVDPLTASLVALGLYAAFLVLHHIVRRRANRPAAVVRAPAAAPAEPSAGRPPVAGAFGRVAGAAPRMPSLGAGSDLPSLRPQAANAGGLRGVPPPPDLASILIGETQAPAAPPRLPGVLSADPGPAQPRSVLHSNSDYPAVPDAKVAERADPALPPGGPVLSPREADVEILQALIRKLADEVNAVEAATRSREGGRAQRRQPGRRPIRPLSLGIERVGVPASDDDGEAQASAGAAPQHRDPGLATGQPGTAADFDGAAVAAQAVAALAAGRIDLLLQPILELGSHKPRHFEVSLRLRDAAGSGIDLSPAVGVVGSGLLARVEQAGLARTARFALRLEARGRTDQLFSTVSGAAITHAGFLDEVADAFRARETFAGQLVMTFAQADVRGFGDQEWSTLADLADLGFRFALSSVSDLDIDLEGLAVRGFKFVKLDADVFLNGLPLGEDRVPAIDICRHLAGLGLETIVGRIDDEATARAIAGLGVAYGQGYLFGAPRPVLPEVVEPQGGTAAA